MDTTEIERRQNEAWCIRLLKSVSASEREKVSAAIDVFSRVSSDRGKRLVERLLGESRVGAISNGALSSIAVEKEID